MTYSDALADRVRDILPEGIDLRERTMFGGLAFLVDDRMALAVSGRGCLMVRVDPARLTSLATRPGVAATEMRGRLMRGWVDVDLSVLEEDETLCEWVAIGLASARHSATP